MEEQAAALQAFVDELKTMPVAVQTDAANEQHYEVPTAYFQAVLGHHLKYSCCLYESPSSTLEEAEVAALALVCERAGLADGQDVLELGCGWGSLSLFMAAKFPGSSILAVSNSRTQKVTGRGGGGGGWRGGGGAGRRVSHGRRCQAGLLCPRPTLSSAPTCRNSLTPPPRRGAWPT